jgi:hypothetical protein
MPRFFATRSPHPVVEVNPSVLTVMEIWQFVKAVRLTRGVY